MNPTTKNILRPLAEWICECDFRRKWKVNKYLREHDVVKLQLGSGKNILDGWLNTDKSVRGCLTGSVYMDVSKRFPLPDNSVDHVFSEHMFEHLTYPQAKNMLSECHRVMKKGGIIRLATPDIAFLMDLYQYPEKKENREYVAWAAHKGRLPQSPVYVISRFHTAWGHHIIYDYQTLAELLESCGFTDVCRCEMSKSNHAELCDLEGHFHIIPYVFCCMETMILEAIRR